MKKVTFIFRDTEDVDDALKLLAEKATLSKSAILRIAVRKYLESIGRL